MSVDWKDKPWMQWLEKHYGEVEKTGSTPTEFNREIFDHTSLKLNKEMLAGCAATACAALEESGYKSPHNPMAISFKKYGEPCELKPGCIVVFEWDSGSHHVSFCHHIVDNDLVACLGGNQRSKLQTLVYKRNHIIATRWPVK